MKPISTVIVIIAFASLCLQSLNAKTVVWDLQSQYGITQAGIAEAISDARTHFSNYPNDTIIIEIAAGTYSIGGNGSHGINLRDGILSKGSKGRLIFQGAGMNETILEFTDRGEDMINGRDVYHLEFRDTHFSRPFYTVTQGTVVSVAPGEVVLDIEDDFPTPLELFNNNFGQGRYLRKYTKSKTDPLVIHENNGQVAWGWRNDAPFHPELIEGNRWRIYLNSPTQEVSYYAEGDYIGIKSKFAGNAYWFVNGDDLVFRNIKWTHSSRGLVRGGFSNVTLSGCRLERGAPINGQVPCMSTPSGGPQMNQNNDDVSTNMVVEDCFFDSSGDDNIAFFNVNGGVVRNTLSRNAFARGVLATNKAVDICVANSVVENTYLLDETVNPEVRYWSTSEATVGGGVYNNYCDENFVGATGITVIPSIKTLDQIGDTVQLTAIITPSDATYKNVHWSTSNFSIAMVDENGLVTANSAGTATITATTIEGGFSDACVITVNPVAVTGVEVSPTSATLEPTQTLQLTETVSPVIATDKSVTWSCDNPSVAIVNQDGLVKAYSEGTANITVATNDGNFTATCEVTISPPTRIQNCASANSIRVFPNPTSGNLNLIIDTEHDHAIANILDLSGRVLISRPLYGENNTIEIGGLSPGVYLISVNNDHRAIYNQIIIKMK
jgi:uncharacterized protein YjdB